MTGRRPNAWRLWHLTTLLDRDLTAGDWGPLTVDPEAPTDFYATCPHGNEPPSIKCPCGVHFLNDEDSFFRASTTSDAHRLYSHKIVASVGEPIGRTMPDRSARNQKAAWGGEHPSRATGFRIKALAVSPRMPDSSNVAMALTDEYHVPCVVARWDTALGGNELGHAAMEVDVAAGKIQ